MKIIGGIAIITAALFTMWFVTDRLIHPTYTFRYRLTVEVDDNGVLKKGSSVIEESVGTIRTLDAGVRTWTEITGDAVFVDLSEGQNMIATFGFGPKGDQDRFGGLIARAFHLRVNDGPNEWGPELQLKTDTAELEAENIPTLVTFHDLSDPQSAVVLAPDSCQIDGMPNLIDLDCHTFEDLFGHGVHFKRAWVEMTKDPVSRQISKRLTWLPHPTYLNGNFACGPKDTQCLDGGDFTR